MKAIRLSYVHVVGSIGISTPGVGEKILLVGESDGEDLDSGSGLDTTRWPVAGSESCLGNVCFKSAKSLRVGVDSMSAFTSAERSMNGRYTDGCKGVNVAGVVPVLIPLDGDDRGEPVKCGDHLWFKGDVIVGRCVGCVA